MSLQQNFSLLARYNQWMNNNIYQLCARLSTDQLWQNKAAFFGSVAGTLNHLVVADLIWLNRFKQLAEAPELLSQLTDFPQPKALDQLLYTDFEPLWQARKRIDALLLAFCNELNDQHLQQVLHYKNMKGELQRKKFAAVLQHLLNHQTHHRGQVTTLLSQLGVEVGVTDLLMLIENEPVDYL